MAQQRYGIEVYESFEQEEPFYYEVSAASEEKARVDAEVEFPAAVMIYVSVV